MLLRSASVDISPTTPLPLAGFGDRIDAPYLRINDPLEVNAISLEQEGRQVTLLSFDTLSVGRRIDEVARQLFGDTCITLASHTHFAPALDGDLPALGGCDDSYLDAVTEKLNSLKTRLDATEPVAVSLAMGRVRIPSTINRRRRALGPDGKVRMRTLPNATGPKNDIASILLFSGAESARPAALLWSFACHPVSFHDATAVSSDFCGRVRQAVRLRYGSSLPCVFAQGFCGDVRPPSFGMGKKTPPNIFRHGIKRLLQGRCFGEFTPAQWDAWSGEIAQAITAAELEPVGSGQSLDVAHAELPLTDMHESPANFGDRPGLSCTFVGLGEHIHFWALSGEPVTEIERLLPPTEAVRIAAGYSGHMFGYLPTSAILAEGGYEAEGFRPAFSLAGRYRADLSDILSTFFAKVWDGRSGGRIAQ